MKKFGMIGLVAVLSAVPAFALTVDGNPSDWGIVVGDNNTSNWTWNPNLNYIGTPYVDDQNDLADLGGYVGPAYGGQKFDAEFMAVAQENGRVHMIIVTGQRPSNGVGYFEPGDIRIEANGQIYGIEVSGATYVLNSNGYVAQVNSTPTGQAAGTMWSNVTWLNSNVPTVPSAPVQFEINANSVQYSGVEFAYSGNSLTTQHAVIEVSFDASILGPNGTPAMFAWRPACGNDEVVVCGLVTVPEPTSMLCVLAGAVLFRKRR